MPQRDTSKFRKKLGEIVSGAKQVRSLAEGARVSKGAKKDTAMAAARKRVAAKGAMAERIRTAKPVPAKDTPTARRSRRQAARRTHRSR